MKSVIALNVFAALLLTTTLSFAQEAAAPVTPSQEAAVKAEAPAPVAADPAAPKPAWLEYKNPYVAEETNIANPHRTGEEIAIWAQQAVADVLSLNKDNYKDRLSSFKKYFLPDGWTSYAAYMRDTKLINMVSEGGFSASTIVDETPEVVNHGSSGGVYHWIVKMPLTLSFFAPQAAEGAPPADTGKYTLYIDVQRSTAIDNDGLAINNWRVANEGEHFQSTTSSLKNPTPPPQQATPVSDPSEPPDEEPWGPSP